ncbi:DUF4174 domain-containing protein [Pseudomonas typographi]|uniref:DUF4174 domain-containing protein n=1 Tax=Pseudomonas typographi TaxID=2715964 RepID=A0ABR7Z2N8_9PSED|nr:DUF4174 domain-containing protein [Pseudomonas typographi]MBD1553550.1 DUF4174 domain-containing protein [Pseudomonas typographi]MBD1587303.1 DUF4174 domain-containing protein [Pseudomonas typographi]MBD1599619.1 DUF4174 domain-containing protein [Pseudomonas typographi]
MLIRSLALATLFAASTPLLAADSDSPLAKDRGHSRAVVVITRSSVDPDLQNLQKALAEPANQKGFAQRNMVLYTVADMIGKRNGENLDAQATMALIRDLQLGVSNDTKTLLFGKDGERRFEKDGAVTPEELFSAVDQLPAEEKNAAPAAAAASAAEPATAPAGKPGKGGKKAAEPLDD